VRHSDVVMGNYKRSDVEDITGCIPLLLDKCVVDGKIDLQLRSFKEEALCFVEKIRCATFGEPYRWERYVPTYSTLRT